MALAALHCPTGEDLVDAVEGRVGALSVSYALVAQTGAPPNLAALAEGVVSRVKARLGSRAAVDFSLDPLDLSLRLSSPLSLWLNESVDNALRHGLAGASDGRLFISGGLDQDGFRLQVADNGRGLVPGFDRERQGRLGLRLIWAVAESDLRGNAGFISLSPGLAVGLTMPEKEFNKLNQDPWR